MKKIQAAGAPEVSVILPVYGTEALLGRCLDSILAQDLPGMEILVVDDGSPGQVRRVLAPYLAKDKRIRLLCHEKNLGLFQARLTGAAAASGGYLYFMDSDDYLSPDYLPELLGRARASGAELTLGSFVLDEAEGTFVYPCHVMTLDCGFLEGEAVRTWFFEGELSCYGIHTMWNRLISRSLWERALPWLAQMQGHVVMTEDIAFSAVLYYEAESLLGDDGTAGEAYHYCRTRGSATDAASLDLVTFRKRMEDLTRVFAFAEAYLKKKGAGPAVLSHFHEGRRRYGRLWKHLAASAFSGRDKKRALALARAFCPDAGTLEAGDGWYESVRVPWTGGLSYLAARAAAPDQDWVSFDCFDTLLTRPFYKPADLFSFLDPLYRKLTGAASPFSPLRIRGEQAARAAGRLRGLQDVGISEIYRTIGLLFGIRKEILQALLAEELRLEGAFVKRRAAGARVFERARRAGKKILILSDMYLSSETIGALLSACGYEGWEAILVSSEEGVLKETGDLYRRALHKYPEAIGRLLHVGDSWRADVEGSRKAGIPSLFLPAAREVFEDRIQGCPAGALAEPAAPFLGRLFVQEGGRSLGFRCMQALVLQSCLDDPYRPFAGSGSFNADPALLGYYGLGMHLMGLAVWMEQVRKNCGYGRIWFLSRDGDLPMQVYETLFGKETAGYLYCSRRSLLPMMAETECDFYQLPISPTGQSPRSLLALLDFACGPSREEAERIFREAGLRPERRFVDAAGLEEGIRLFLSSCYSREKHLAARNLIRRSFACVRRGDVFFDTGSSGRIQEAICRALPFSADVFYICEDRQASGERKRAGGFQVHSLYPFLPRIRGMMREILVSDPGGSCLGYREEEGRVLPVLEEAEPCRDQALVLSRIRRGALDFARDFKAAFGDGSFFTDLDAREASLPLEGMLAGMTEKDLTFFEPFVFEDRVFGGGERIRVRDLYREQLSQAGLLQEAGKETPLPAGRARRLRALAGRLVRKWRSRRGT